MSSSLRLLHTTLGNASRRTFNTQRRHIRTTCVSNLQQTPVAGSAATLDFRRMSQRKGWGIPDDDETADYWLFPNERLGCDYSLNWAINGYQITPSGDAYRNLHTRGLQMLSKGSVDTNKASHVTVSDKENTQLFVVSSADSSSSSSSLPSAQYSLLFRELRRYLSSIDNIFVQDGAVGSAPFASCVTRGFTDSGHSALFLKHTLCPVPNRSVNDIEHDITLFVARDIKLSPEASKGLDSSFTIVDTANSRVVVIGDGHSADIQRALFVASSHTAAAPSDVLGVVPLNNSNVFVNKDDQTTVVFSPPGSSATFLQENLPRTYFGEKQALFAAHHSFLGQAGIVKAWSSVTSPDLKSLSRGDLVERSSKQTLATKPLQPVVGNVAPTPSRVLFLVSGGGAKKSVSAETAVKHYAATLPADVANREELAKQFGSLVTNGKVLVETLGTKSAKPESLGL
eukprot:TRINITY_DN14685_c0_g1_i1.p1 TRINITY_DN14685_c0_g1~~TRINITY_DN14685_c0_g1_i1.p1  ORF type:complete len:499 (-),score=126.48 TRINITY_DN14685_c0_g1_i1:58-1425(-)